MINHWCLQGTYRPKWRKNMEKSAIILRHFVDFIPTITLDTFYIKYSEIPLIRPPMVLVESGINRA